jgi:hypothetical protein
MPSIIHSSKIPQGERPKIVIVRPAEPSQDIPHPERSVLILKSRKKKLKGNRKQKKEKKT